MNETWLPAATAFIIGLAIGLLGSRQKRRVAVTRRNKGVLRINDARRAAKLDAKQKIVDYFVRRPELRNHDVEKILNVSDTTATNYLNEMAREKVITRHGSRGRGVFYTLNEDRLN